MISIIVSLCNPPELTANFFAHLQRLAANEVFQTVVIVDGIADVRTRGLLREARQSLPRLKVILRATSGGYGVANNQAVTAASGDILVFLNSDVFPKPGAITFLAKSLRASAKIGIVQGLLLYPQTLKVQSAGHVFGAYFNQHALLGRPAHLAIVQRPADRQALTAAFYAVRRADFTAYGGFDEFYLNSHEGMEFALKLSLDGRRCIFQPKAVAFHIQGGGRRHFLSDERQQLARFWALWGSRIKQDLEDLIVTQLQPAQRKRKYLLVHASSSRTWREALERMELRTSPVAEIGVSARGSSLHEALAPDIQRTHAPLLFATDHFSQVASNAWWFQSRRNRDDLIIDCHGNAVSVAELT